MGSDSDAGGEPSGEQQAGAAGTETGTGTGEGESADNAGPEDASPGDADEAKDEPSDRGAPFLEDGSDGENDSGGDGAAPDLLALVTPTTVVAEEDASADEEGGSVGGSSGAGEPQADEQPISENQFALAASRAPQETSSGEEPAPTRRTGPAETAPVVEQDAASLSERVRARADRRAARAERLAARAERLAARAERLAATPVAEPAALQGAGQRQAVVEPAVTETFGTAPVATAPVATAPVATAPVATAQAPVPAAVSSGPAFVSTRSGGLNGARAVHGALPAAGPRLGGAGPAGTPGPAF